MENILKIIYDKSVNDRILDLEDIEKILEILVIDNDLNDYILNLNFQPIGSNNLASYSSKKRNITVYIKTINEMIKNIEENILNVSNLEKTLYKNLSILQIILHEVEHVKQEKKLYLGSNLETFILRISRLIYSKDIEKLYEYSPNERFAEIKSFEQIIKLLYELKSNIENLQNILSIEKLQRLLRGYHYSNYSVNSPLITYFKLGNNEKLLSSFEWYNIKYEVTINKVVSLYSLNERLKYGFPITTNEYKENMKFLVLSLNKNFSNRINIK